MRFNVLLLLNSMVVWKRDFLMLNIWKSVKCNLFGLKRKYKNDVISLQYLMTSRNPRPPLLFNFSIWGHFRYFKQFLAHLLSFDLRSPLCQLMWATRSRLIQIEQIRIYLNKNTESQMRKQVTDHHHDSNQALFSQNKSSLTELVELTCLTICVHQFRVCTFWAAKFRIQVSISQTCH